MKASKLLFAGLFSLVGCTELNANHCAASISKCPESMICSDLTGRCEAPAAALAVTAVSPSLLPSGTDNQSKIVTVSGSGFKTAGIKSVRIDGQDVSATVISDSELMFDSSLLAPMEKCGPMDVAVVGVNGGITKAPAESFGRKYHKWTYSNSYAPVDFSKKTITDFSVRKFDGNPFDFSYTDADGVSVVAIGAPIRIFQATGFSNAYKKVFRSSLSKAAPSESFPVYISNASSLIISIKALNGNLLSNGVACDKDYTLVDFSAFGPSVNPNMLIACHKANVMDATKKDILFRALTSTGTGLTEKNYLPLSSQLFSLYSMSFPSNSDGLGALIVQSMSAPNRFALQTITDFDGQISNSPGVAISGTAPSVFSVMMSTASSNVIRHYVASNVNDTVAIEMIDGKRDLGVSVMDGPNELLQILTPAMFSGKNLEAPNVELIDINCDGFPDFVIKLDNVIVSYLATGAGGWDWSSAPKILYRNDGQTANIKKHELWVPNYVDIANQRGPTAVLGVLNADGNFRLYRQE